MTQEENFESGLSLLLVETKKVFGFDVVAVRIVDPFGFMPFAVCDGMSADFYEEESLIRTDVECLCGKVIRSEVRPDLPFYTKQGSFWTNSLSEMGKELEKYGIELRKHCMISKYETVLIAPIKSGNKIGGSLFFASRKKNLLTKEDVELLENSTVMASEEVFKKMRECDKYANIIRFVALGDGKNREDFAEFIHHVENCPSCHNFYSKRLEFDGLIRKSMTEVSPPHDLKFVIIESISKDLETNNG